MLPDERRLPATLEPSTINWASLFINPYGPRQYSFNVGLTSDELVIKLNTDTAGFGSTDMLFRRKPFHGSISGDSFKLSWLKKAMKNSWEPVAVGRITPMGNQTRVDVTFRTNHFVRIFIWVWMAGAIAAAVGIGFAASNGTMPLTFAIIPFVFPLFGVLITAVGSSLGRSDQRRILQYLSELPETEVIEGSRFIE